VSVGSRSDNGKEFHSFGTQAEKLWYNLNLDMGVTRVASFRAKMTHKLFTLGLIMFIHHFSRKKKCEKNKKQAHKIHMKQHTKPRLFGYSIEVPYIPPIKEWPMCLGLCRVLKLHEYWKFKKNMIISMPLRLLTFIIGVNLRVIKLLDMDF